VARDSIDAEYAAHRQRFLAEQGYAYRIVDADDLLGPVLPDVESEGEPDSERQGPE
jgi:DNA excision repair protein ERCC-3